MKSRRRKEEDKEKEGKGRAAGGVSNTELLTEIMPDLTPRHKV